MRDPRIEGGRAMTARGWLILSAVVAVGALAVSIESRDGIDDDRWIEVTEAPFVRRIHAAGELRSADTVVVGCPPVQGMWNFTITWLETEGKEVAEGQRILSFDGQRKWGEPVLISLWDIVFWPQR